MKTIISIIILVLICSGLMGQSEENMLFGTASNPAALDTLINADSTQSRTIIFKYPDHMGGAISVSGYAKTLTGSNAVIIPKWSRVYRTDTLKTALWHSMSSFVASGGTGTGYELEISAESAYQMCWGYAVRFVTATVSHTTEIEAIGSHR
jgi:hypothetical protein